MKEYHGKGLSETDRPVRSSYADPITFAEEVVPADDTDLSAVARALYIGGTGDVKVTMAEGGQEVTFKALAVGWHPISVSRVWETGTTATDIVAGW
jgi:hypothetical protein